MAYLEAFGAYLPPRIVSNAELAAKIECDPNWIRQASGIAERRYADEDCSVADMAVKASAACLEQSRRSTADIRLLIVASGSEPRRFPGVAAAVAQRLGMDQIPALDVPMPSAGALVGMILGNAMASTYGTVLVVAAEKMSAIALREPLDRNIAILFGDGAGACLLNADTGRARMADHVLHSDGSFTDALSLQADGTLVMDGRSVILQASRKLPRAISEILERNQLSPGTVDTFLLHQANQNLTDTVARGLRVSSDRLFSNIERYGNTSSASMLIAAAEWQSRHGFRKDAPVVFAAFGAGFHWGALLAIGT